MASTSYFKKLHSDFEAAASRLGVTNRSVEQNVYGIDQHVVRIATGGLFRWPVWYEWGTT